MKKVRSFLKIIFDVYIRFQKLIRFEEIYLLVQFYVMIIKINFLKIIT